MAGEIKIAIRVSDDGSVSLIQQTGQRLEDLGRSAEKGKQGVFGLGLSLTDLKSGFDIMKGALSEAGGLIMQVNDLGVASLRAKDALNALSGGQAAQYLDAMSKATGGLVDNMALAQDATKMLGLGLVTSADQAAKLTRAGTILGQAFKGSATEGVETLTVAMTRVGLTGLLDNIGISGEKVKKRFEELKSTLGEDKAWHAAVLEEATRGSEKLAGSLDNTGTAVDRLKVKFANFAQSAAENVAVGVEAIVGTTDALINKAIEDQKKLIAATPGWERDPSMGRGGGGGASFGGGELFPPNFDYGQLGGVTARMAAYGRMGAASDAMAASGRQRAEMQSEMDMWIAYRNYLRERQEAEESSINARVAAYSKLATAQRNYQSTAEAFGLGGGGIGGEIGGDMGDLVGGRRAALARRYGAKSGQVAEFDIEAKRAMDDYAIATGQATKESITFRDAKSQLDASFSAGKLSVSEYTKALLSLAKAAQDGHADISNIYSLMIKSGNLKAPDWWTAQYGGDLAQFSADEDADIKGRPRGKAKERPTEGGQIKNPYEQVAKGAQDAQTATRNVGAQMLATSGAMLGIGGIMALSLRPLQTAADATVSKVAAISSALQGLVGTLTINVGFSGSGGGGGRLDKSRPASRSRSDRGA